MSALVLDLETKKSFREVGNDYTKLGVSMVGVYDYDSDEYECYTEHEFPKLFHKLEKASTVIGYNIRKFDFPVLAPYYVGNIDYWPCLDLMEDVHAHLGYRVSLDSLVKETLGLAKNGHGLLAIELFKNGELDKLKEYCFNDVKVTKALYEFGKKYGVVLFRDSQGLREIPVKWKDKKLDQAIPLTLGF